jgi:PAS domain S-box-containing protein
MKNNEPISSLRQRAEELAQEKVVQPADNIEARSPEEIQRMFQELRVHQIELEMQNEELRRAQAELNAERARYFDLYDLAPVGYLTLSEKGLILEANLTAASLLGIARGVMIQQMISRFVIEEDHGIFYHHIKKLLKTGDPQVSEFRMIRTNDAPFWARVEASTTQDPSGISKCRFVISDISERKHAEEALRESDARYRAVAQSAHDAIVTVDSAGKIAGWNQGAEHIFGYTEIEANSQPLTMLLPSRYHDGHLAGMARMQAGGEKHIIGKIVEVEGRRKDGSEVPLELSLAEWRVTDGRFYTAIIRDITRRKLLEEQFRQSQKLEAIGQLAGGVAHDFNNILGVMMMRLSILQKNKSLDSESLETVLDLTIDTKRSASLTRQLLLFSRRSIMKVELLDLNELVKNLFKMVRRLIGEDITVRFDRREDLPSVEADAVMLEQVVMNLSLNARDAMPNGGSLAIDIEPIQIVEERVQGNMKIQAGQFVCLSVADTGCGMDEATLKRIFEPFFTTKEVGKGTGLGLATVHGIVTQHKGWVEVESEPGKGTTFKVFLPATTKRKAEPTQTEKTAVIRGHETILLVEDDANLRQVVGKGLRLLGYRVLEAENGQIAMKLWEEQSHLIDLLFSDIRMPEGITGLDLAEKLKEEKPNLKVIISSGYIMELTGQGKLSGSIEYFQKPYEFVDLSKKIRDCLDKA